MEKILISDAAKQVEVETHVLRYWEEELRLPIQRNKQGHRFYTKEDVDRFRQIKRMKEQGFQLKAIRSALKNEEEKSPVPALVEDNKAEKAARLQFLLQNMITHAVKENNAEICQNLKETIVKELDFQFRQQEESMAAREEEHYKKLDELLRTKSIKEPKKRRKWF